MGVITHPTLRYMIGDAFVTTIEEENWTFQNEVTERPMEDGSTISDNVKNKLKTIKSSGIILGYPGMPVDEKNIILDHWKNGEVIHYVGRETIWECVIENFSYKYNKDIDQGMSFDITVKEVRYATKTTVSVGVTALNIPDIEALKDELSAQKSEKKKAIASGIRVNGTATAGRKTKKTATAKKIKTKKAKESVLQKIIERY